MDANVPEDILGSRQNIWVKRHPSDLKFFGRYCVTCWFLPLIQILKSLQTPSDTVDCTESCQEFWFLGWDPVAFVGSIVLRPLSSVGALPASFFPHWHQPWLMHVTPAASSTFFIHFLTCWIKHNKCCFKRLFLFFLSFLALFLSYFLIFFLSDFLLHTWNLQFIWSPEVKSNCKLFPVW